MTSTWCNEHNLVVEDFETIASDIVIPWSTLQGKRILVTGATGFIGSFLVKSLLYYAETRNLDLQIDAQIRNREKANCVFSGQKEFFKKNLNFVEWNILENTPQELSADYIIHTASNTASQDFVKSPVETIMTTLKGTESLLEFCRVHHVLSMVYLSSMEVYGQMDHELVKESDSGYLDPLDLRSSYPQSKRMAETLCAAYAAQHSVNVKIVRPTLTFGAGVPETDNRVYAQFARAALKGEDIVLHTRGMTKRDYLYTADAIRSILTVLLLGGRGKAYNLSNPETYSSILDMAKLVSSLGKKCKVTVKPNDDLGKTYAKEVHICLDSTEFNYLNSFSHKNLREMYERMMAVMQDG